MISEKQLKSLSEIFLAGKLLKHYSLPIMQDIGINQQGLLNALKILKELSIKIQFINTFYQVDKKLALCDFSYSGNSINECYVELFRFLDGLNDTNELFYSVDFITDNPESIELNIFLDKIALQIT